MLTRINIREAEKLMGCSKNTIYRGIESGRMPIARKVKNEKRTSYYIYRELVEKWQRGEL